MGFLRNEAADPGVEEEYQNFTRAPFFFTPTAVSHLAQQSLGQFLRLSLRAWIVNGRTE